jgi:hypothetical protein
VGTVAGRLELVKRARVGFVVRRQLVDDENVPARPRDSSHLGHDEVRALDVMQRAVRADEVEGAVLELHRRSISLDELGVRERAGTRELEQLRNRIEPDDLPHERRQRECQRAGARPDVECALAWAGLRELAHLFGELCGTRVLPRGDPFGRAGEAVSHGRSGAPGRSRH